MTGAATAPSWWSSPAFRLGLIAAVVVSGVLLIGGPDRNEGPPLDPESTGGLGTRALVLLLEELGAEVDVTGSPPGGEADVALVLADDLDESGRASVREWVDGGGTLVVADPGSALVPFRPGAVAEGPLEGGCEVPALAEVSGVDPSGGVLYDLPPGTTGCFGEAGQAFVAVTDSGAGTVVAIGGAGAFVNDVIGSEDNAVMAGALLAPAPGTRVAFLQPPVAGSGTEGLSDLVGDGVRAALLQLAVAFVVYALWRARRLGRPIPERAPVELPASELVVAVGNLLQRGGRREQAGALLREDLRRRLAERLGLAPASTAEEVAQVASARTGIPVERMRAVIHPGPVPREEDLVALAAEGEAIRQEVSHV